MGQFGRINDKGPVRVDHSEVGVGTRGDAALAPQTDEIGRAGAHPAGQLGQVVTAAAGLGPHRGEAELHRGDPAPRLREVARIECLTRRRGRRMVGHHPGEQTLGKPLPQRVPVALPADGRRALVQGRSVGNLVGGERQIVRAGLHGQRDPGVTGGENVVQGTRRGQVQDVQAGTGRGRQRGEPGHRLGLRGRWTRGQPARERPARHRRRASQDRR